MDRFLEEQFKLQSWLNKNKDLWETINHVPYQEIAEINKSMLVVDEYLKSHSDTVLSTLNAARNLMSQIPDMSHLQETIARMTPPITTLLKNLKDTYDRLNSNIDFSRIISKPSYSFEEIKPTLKAVDNDEENSSTVININFENHITHLGYGELFESEIFDIYNEIPLDMKNIILNMIETQPVFGTIANSATDYLTKHKLTASLVIVYLYLLLASPHNFIDFNKELLEKVVKSANSEYAVTIFGLVGIYGAFFKK